jgi:hypothetical protein
VIDGHLEAAKGVLNSRELDEVKENPMKTRRFPTRLKVSFARFIGKRWIMTRLAMSGIHRATFRPGLEALETREVPSPLSPHLPRPAPLPPRNQAILNYAEVHAKNHQLAWGPDGTATCADLLLAALQSAGVSINAYQGAGMVGQNVHYKWGSSVYQLSKEKGWGPIGSLKGIVPGDLVQYDGVRFRGHGQWMEMDHHSAIVESVNPKTGEIRTIDQNADGKTYPIHMDVYIGDMTSGVMTVYQP